MKFKAGDRVHVTRLDRKDVNFCGTLTKDLDTSSWYMKLTNCTDANYNNILIYTPRSDNFGKYNQDYYTLATDENKRLRWSDGSSAEGNIVIADEEDTDPVEVQHIKRENKIELDNHYIIEVKKGLYVALVTSNGYLKLTKEINKADVYEYENAAMKHAEFVDGRILPIKRYGEVE